MGTEHYFLCENCMEYWGMGKENNAARFLPALQKRHKGHITTVFSEHDYLNDLLSPFYSDHALYTYKDCFKDGELKRLPTATNRQVDSFTKVLLQGVNGTVYERVEKAIRDNMPEEVKGLARAREEERKAFEDTTRQWEKEALGVPESFSEEEEDRILGICFYLCKSGRTPLRGARVVLNKSSSPTLEPKKGGKP